MISVVGSTIKTGCLLKRHRHQQQRPRLIHHRPTSSRSSRHHSHNHISRRLGLLRQRLSLSQLLLHNRAKVQLLLGVGGIVTSPLIIGFLPLFIVGVWAFIEFIMILLSVGEFAHDAQGVPLQK